MNTKINLILEKEGVKTDLQKYLYYSIGFFSIICVITAAILGYNFILQQDLDAKRKDKINITQEFASHEKKKVNIALINERLADVEKIMKERGKLIKNLLEAMEKVSKDLKIDGIDISLTKVSVGITSKNLAQIDDLLRTYHEIDKGKTKAKQIKLYSFGIDNEKLIYNVKLEFNF